MSEPEDPRIGEIRRLFALAASFTKPREGSPKDSRGNPFCCDTENPLAAVMAWTATLVAIMSLPAWLRADPWVNVVEGDVLYGIACMYALLGDKTNALHALDHAVNTGYSKLELLEADPDMVSLRGEPQFKTLLAFAAEREKPSAP